MKKSLLAVAVLGAFAGAASAQSSVTLFGTVDVALERSTTTLGNGGSTTNKTMTNNRQGTSGLYIRGVEDLGGGLSAGFLWEGDFDATRQQYDPANTTLANNPVHAAGAGGGEVYVALNGGFGSIKLGSPNTPTLLSQAGRQPIGTKLGSGFGTGVMGTAHVRQDKSLRYDTPVMGGFQAMIDIAESVSTSSLASGVSRGRIYDLGLNYAAGPVAFWATYYKQSLANNKLLTLTGSYDLGVAKLMLGYHKESSDIGAGPAVANNKGWNFAGVVPVTGQLGILFNYMKLDDTNPANLDKKVLAIGPKYSLSKRSSIYARYVRETNDNVAATSAASVKTMLVGMQHNF